MALETELHYFEERRSELLERHAGRFALIVGCELLGLFDLAEDAYRAGLERVGNAPMLIKQIVPDDPIGSAPALTFGLFGAGL